MQSAGYDHLTEVPPGRRVAVSHQKPVRQPSEAGIEVSSMNAGAPGRFPVMLTKTDMAYWQVRQEILEGTLPPGTSLDQEALALRLGLSTTPVREALRRLESERLVVGRAHRDTVVADLSLEVLEDTYVVRLTLDPLAVSLAAKEASDAQLEAMATQANKQASDDPVGRLHHNRELHRVIYTACGNKVLIEVLELLWDRSDRYRYITITEEGHEHSPHDEHMAILDAVTSRDGVRAAQLMRDHVERSLQTIRQSPQIANK